MIERWKNEDGSDTIIVTDEPARRSLPRRVLGIIGKTLILILLCLLPLYLIYRGLEGLSTGELTMSIGPRGPHKLYGKAAIVGAWFHLGFGIAIIGYMFRNELKPVFKWLLWL